MKKLRLGILFGFVLSACVATSFIACSDSTCAESASCAPGATPTDDSGKPIGDSSPSGDANDPNNPDGPSSVDANPCDDAHLYCSNTCVDASTDTKHCGRCGHACIGTTKCVGGKCQPYTVIAAQTGASDPIASGGRVFWLANASGSHLHSVNDDGSDFKTHYDVTDGSACGGLRVIGTTLYFGCVKTATDVRSCTVPTCTLTTSVATLPMPNPASPFTGFDIDPATNNYYYVTQNGIFNNAGGSRIGDVNQNTPSEIRFVGGYVYWLDRGTYDDVNERYVPNGGIYRAKLTSPTVQELVLGTNNTYTWIAGMLVDGVDAYYGGSVNNTNDYHLVGPATPKTTPTPLAQSLKPAGRAFDETNIYFGNNNTHKLMYCPRANACANGPIELADGDAIFITTDDKSVLWFDGVTHNIQRITKP